MNLREEILACDDIEKETITVKQWGGKKVEVRGMTAKQRFTAIKKATDSKTGEIDTEKMTLYMVIVSVYDPKTGELLFTPDDYKTLENKSSAAIDRISEVIQKLNGLGEEEQKAIEKN